MGLREGSEENSGYGEETRQGIVSILGVFLLSIQFTF